MWTRFLTHRGLLVALLLVNAMLLSATYILAQDHDEAPHWTYEGEEGPDHWGEIAPDFALCADGTAQSPIDIIDATSVDLSNIEFGYSATALNIFNNGHTIQVNADEGSSITYNGITYDLLQFHFHHPSEHIVNGEPAAMEIHFVHRDPNSGNLAVVGVLLTVGDATNEAYSSVFDNLPAEAGEPQPSDISVDLNGLLPEQQTFFTYQGSLTTPPCSEIVRWLVLSSPVELSEAQIEAFGSIFEMNARPAQPLGERDLLLDTSA